MEKIYTIGRVNGHKKSKCLSQYPTDDVGIHNKIKEDFSRNNIDKLVIYLPSELGKAITNLKIGFHIRLMPDILREKAFIPIIFVSEWPLRHYLKDCSPWSQIFTTGGCYFFNLEKMEREIDLVNGIEFKKEYYGSQFLDRIKIDLGEKYGRHSIANQWGALRLDKISNLDVLKSEPNINNIQKTIYFKFLKSNTFSTFNPAYYNKKPENKISRCNKNKKVCLIDDESHKGWGKVLTAIFKKWNIELSVINVDQHIDNFESLNDNDIEKIKKNDIDLYLVDLRLNGVKEKDNTKPKKFSGAKILRKIKDLNPGNQVIVFTASNKAWNMKKLLHAPFSSDGYYIKESPESNFSIHDSIANYDNFIETVDKCLSISFLKRIFRIHQEIKENIKKNESKYCGHYVNFYKRTLNNLDFAFNLLESSKEDVKYFNYSFLTYYQIIEDYTNKKENIHKSKENWIVKNKNSQNIIVIDGEIKPKKWKLKFINRDNNNKFDYFIKDSELNDHTVTTLAKVSFILCYKFDKGNECLKKWGQLNELRNRVSVHRGRKSDGINIKENQLFDILEYVKLFLTNS